MSKKDLTKLSNKQLESMLAKKYGVEKYLNQKSQLLDLLGRKGETDIQSGFTGPETEAMSIMLENIMKSTKKAEGGIVALLGGGKVNAPRQTEIKGQDHMLAYITPEEGGLLKALGGAGKKGPMGIPSFYETAEESEGTTESEVSEAEAGMGTGDDSESMGPMGGSPSNDMGIDSSLSDMESIQAGLEAPGHPDIGGSESEYMEEVRKKAEEEVKPDNELTQQELDYFARGMGTATKPLKTLGDINEYMSTLVGTTASPTGAKLSSDKKFLILPNGKIINLRTGKVTEAISGLELFRGGLI
jgi:hypothetical protein